MSNHPWTTRMLRDGAASNRARKIRLDSWVNMLTGLGTARDKTTYTLPVSDVLLTPQMLEILYHSSDIAARIVSAIPDEAFKRPYKIVSRSAMQRAGVHQQDLSVGASDEDEARYGSNLSTRDAKRGKGLQKVAEKTNDSEAVQTATLESDIELLGAREKQHEAMTWGRLYGLGAILLGADDGLLHEDAWMPLDDSAIRSVDFLTILDRRDLVPYRWYADVMAPKFGDIAIYQVQPVGVYMGAPVDPVTPNNSLITCHETRLIRFGAELTSKRERLRNQGSDYSVLQKCFRALQLVDNNWQSASALLADASQAVYKIKGLMDMISQEPGIMQDRMALVDQMRSVLRGVVLDADGEDFDRKPTSFSGIPEMLRETWARLGAAARMPVIMLMGTSTKGLGDTGDSEVRWWYDTVASTQERVVGPQAERIVSALAAAHGFDPDAFAVVFPPLWQMSEKEQADLHLQQAQADAVYIDRGVATPEEIAVSRFSTEGFSLDTKIDIDARLRIMALALVQAEQEVVNSLAAARNPQPPPAAPSESPDPKPPGEVEN